MPRPYGAVPLAVLAVLPLAAAITQPVKVGRSRLKVGVSLASPPKARLSLLSKGFLSRLRRSGICGGRRPGLWSGGRESARRTSFGNSCIQTIVTERKPPFILG